MSKIVINRAKNGKPFLNLIADNGQVLATSETYESKQNAYKGAEAIIKAAETAEIIDRT